MNSILQNLLKLQALEFGETTAKNVEAQTAELRGNIPQPIIGHYERLRVRGKKGIAVVRNQVCTGCHMHVPIGQINMLMRDEDVQLCESCGRYLYLPDPAETAAQALVETAKAAAKPAAKPAVKTAAKPRKRRVLAHAA
jgi:predicted  nucleic acid-binding Zn-ribbon protein